MIGQGFDVVRKTEPPMVVFAIDKTSLP